MMWMRCFAVLIIALLPVCFSGDNECLAPMEGQQLRTYINSNLLVSIREGNYQHVIQSAGLYLNSRCPPKTHIDSIRTAYIFAHLAFSFDATGNYKDVSNTFEQGRFFMGLLPDTLQIRLLRGVAWAYSNQNKFREASRLALLSTRLASRNGFLDAQQDSWLCYLAILENQEATQQGFQMPYWLLPWLLCGFLMGAIAGLVRTFKRNPVVLLIELLRIP